MGEKPVRRVVTGHDERGKAVVVSDGASPQVSRSSAGNVSQLLWVTAESPADLSRPVDGATRKTAVPPPPTGSIFRIVDFPPQQGEPPAGFDHGAMLERMGIAAETQGHVRHPFTHRTRSIDYAIVLDGEIDMLLDEEDVHLVAGDVVVQQATNHAWVNRSDRPCRICFVLIDAMAPPAWEQGWTP